MPEAAPFRLLDLPKELRLRIYESIPLKITHHDFSFPSRLKDNHTLHCTLVRKSINGTAILATCSQVSYEAYPILETRMEELEKEPVRLLVNFPPDRSDFGIVDCLMGISLDTSNTPRIKVLQKALSLRRYQNLDPQLYDATPREQRQVHLGIVYAGDANGRYANGLARLLEDDGCYLNTANSFLQIHGRRNTVFVIRHVFLPVDVCAQVPDPTAEQERWLGDWEARDPCLIRLGDEIERAEWDEDWAEGE